MVASLFHGLSPAYFSFVYVPPTTPSRFSYEESDSDVTLKASPRTLTNLSCKGCEFTAAAAALPASSPRKHALHKPRHRRVSGMWRAVLMHLSRLLGTALSLIPVLLLSK